MLEITEKEMLDRYVDGLKRAVSHAKEFHNSSPDQKPQLFLDFIDGIKVAAGSAHQLAHAQENPKWLSTRDILEAVIAASQDIKVFIQEDNKHWDQIKTALEGMIVMGTKLATSKAMKRIDVLAHLDERAKNAHLLEGNQTIH